MQFYSLHSFPFELYPEINNLDKDVIEKAGNCKSTILNYVHRLIVIVLLF